MTKEQKRKALQLIYDKEFSHFKKIKTLLEWGYLDEKDKIFLCCNFAREVLPVFEKVYQDDKATREAIDYIEHGTVLFDDNFSRYGKYKKVLMSIHKSADDNREIIAHGFALSTAFFKAMAPNYAAMAALHCYELEVLLCAQSSSSVYMHIDNGKSIKNFQASKIRQLIFNKEGLTK